MDEYRGLREAFDARAMGSQENMLKFSKLLANISAKDLKGLDQKTVSGTFKDHRFMADYAVLLLHQASESLNQETPDVGQVQEALRLGILTLQLQRMAFEQASKAGFEISKKKASNRGKLAAEGLHGGPNSYRVKAEKIREIWASGKYKTRDECARKECENVGISSFTARKALIGR